MFTQKCLLAAKRFEQRTLKPSTVNWLVTEQFYSPSVLFWNLLWKYSVCKVIDIHKQHSHLFTGFVLPDLMPTVLRMSEFLFLKRIRIVFAETGTLPRTLSRLLPYLMLLAWWVRVSLFEPRATRLKIGICGKVWSCRAMFINHQLLSSSYSNQLKSESQSGRKFHFATQTFDMLESAAFSNARNVVGTEQ